MGSESGSAVATLDAALGGGGAGGNDELGHERVQRLVQELKQEKANRQSQAYFTEADGASPADVASVHSGGAKTSASPAATQPELYRDPVEGSQAAPAVLPQVLTPPGQACAGSAGTATVTSSLPPWVLGALDSLCQRTKTVEDRLDRLQGQFDALQHTGGLSRAHEEHMQLLVSQVHERLEVYCEALCHEHLSGLTRQLSRMLPDRRPSCTLEGVEEDPAEAEAEAEAAAEAEAEAQAKAQAEVSEGHEEPMPMSARALSVASAPMSARSRRDSGATSFLDEFRAELGRHSRRLEALEERLLTPPLPTGGRPEGGGEGEEEKVSSHSGPPCEETHSMSKAGPLPPRAAASTVAEPLAAPPAATPKLPPAPAAVPPTAAAAVAAAAAAAVAAANVAAPPGRKQPLPSRALEAVSPIRMQSMPSPPRRIAASASTPALGLQRCGTAECLPGAWTPGMPAPDADAIRSPAPRAQAPLVHGSNMDRLPPQSWAKTWTHPPPPPQGRPAATMSARVSFGSATRGAVRSPSPVCKAMTSRGLPRSSGNACTDAGAITGTGAGTVMGFGGTASPHQSPSHCATSRGQIQGSVPATSVVQAIQRAGRALSPGGGAARPAALVAPAGASRALARPAAALAEPTTDPQGDERVSGR